MGRSSAGGTRTAGGVGHEGRCLAWAAAYMLAEEPLLRWASGAGWLLWRPDEPSR
jgi:hypothetical protein